MSSKMSRLSDLKLIKSVVLPQPTALRLSGWKEHAAERETTRRWQDRACGDLRLRALSDH